MRVVITPQAERDLRAIGDWLALDDADTAERFMVELWDKARAIGLTPMAFPFVPALHVNGVRKRSVRGYIILYRVDPDVVRVLHFSNARRDYLKFLNP